MGHPGEEVSNAVLDFLNGGSLVEGLNATNIVFIPKVRTPSKVSEFRPITLFNVLYKLIAKVLANRLKMVLPHVISPEQSAFIPGQSLPTTFLWPLRRCTLWLPGLMERRGIWPLNLT